MEKNIENESGKMKLHPTVQMELLSQSAPVHAVTFVVMLNQGL